MVLELHQLSGQAIQELSRENTIFVFPIGPIEDHGKSFSVEQDLIEARVIAKKLAEEISEIRPHLCWVLMPVTAHGIETHTSEFSITVRPHVVRDGLVDSSLSLFRSGFSRFIAISGHVGPKQLVAMEDAAKMVSRKNSVKSFVLKTLLRQEVSRPILMVPQTSLHSRQRTFQKPFFLDAEEHGAERDHRIAQLDRTDASSPFPPYVAPTQLQAHAHRSHFFRYWNHLTQKIGGTWRTKTPTLTFDEEISIMVPKILAVLDGASPEQTLKSWYSLFPFHKSFFKSWLIALAFSALLMGWMLLNTWRWLDGE